jgi:mRNA interferase MazF
MAIRRGEIYWVEFDPVKGSEQGGIRPALVVQNDVGNESSPTTVVAAMTRTVPPRRYPFVVVVSPDQSGLPDLGAINCAQLATIQREGASSRFRAPLGENEVRPIGRLSGISMAEVDAALKYNLALS